MSRWLLYLFATFGGTGYAPLAPATAASAAFALLWWLVSPVPLYIQVSLLVGVILLGVPAATRLERVHGPDPKLVVIDEVAGMLVTVCGITTGPWGWVAAFFWFRVFDILKPFPVRACERLPAGWGIVIDDLAAGVYAHLALRLTLALTGW